MFSKASPLLSPIYVAFCWTVFAAITSLTCGETVLEAIQTDPRLSKFREYVEQDVISNEWLKRNTATVFAPTNDAFERFNVNPGVASRLAGYHIVGVVRLKKEFPATLTSTTTIAAPLTVSFKDPDSDYNSVSSYSGYSRDREYYVNNAMIIDTKTGYTSDSSPQQEQLLYIIDEVLEPLLPSGSGGAPTALGLLERKSNYDLSISLAGMAVFANKVTEYKLEHLFEKPGNHTFFIPLEVGNTRRKDIDDHVIKSHVIPNNCLYMRPMGYKNYHSAAFDASIQVEVSLSPHAPLSNTTTSKHKVVQSNTLHREANHQKGVVVSSVLLPNVPVKNGVVHFIKGPLVVIDISITDIFEIEKGNRLAEFTKLLMLDSNISRSLKSASKDSPAQWTIFAPTNEALTRLPGYIAGLRSNAEELKSFLELHIIPKSVSSDDVRNGKEWELSIDRKRTLYFKVAGDDNNRVLTVESRGVNATAVQADIGATNGIIHIIDKVLGVPFQTMYMKLKEDSDLKTSYLVGSRHHDNWNRRLDSKVQKFTYFVPSAQAWDDLKAQMPSEHKQLTEGLLPTHGEQILERHLRVNDSVLTFEELTDGLVIRTMRGEVKVRRTSTNDVYISWENIEAKIVKSDLNSINGVIHVIDKVLMKKRDMTTSASSSSSVTSVLSMVVLMVTILRL